MSEQRNHRVMWLLNHVTARKFEVPMLKSLGIREIFLPKVLPPDPDFRSASVDYSEDANLTIPAQDLALLNGADWYGDPGADAWKTANKHFDVAFFILQRFEMLASVSKHFAGAAIWRTYGLQSSTNYSKNLDLMENGSGWKDIRRMGNRFWFGKAYRGLDEIEQMPLRQRAIHLPIGLADSEIKQTWTGQRKVLFFVCPEISTNPYFRGIYKEFREAFAEFDYLIGGTQPIPVADKRVLGFVSNEEHQSNMRELRVMFYHSREPNHLHYHPLEAVRAGMPLVFMAGGMLDSLGGVSLPGRCRSFAEARDKIRRILADDRKLIDQIRSTQPVLIEPLRPEATRPEWTENFGKILAELERSRLAKRPAVAAPRRKRIAVILPTEYRGAMLRTAKLVSAALWEGSRHHGEAVDVVLGHINDPAFYSENDFADLPPGIARRPYRWMTLDGPAAARAMTYTGFDRWRLIGHADYIVPDDGIRQFLDCDLWVVISDRMTVPVLPIRPYILLVQDYPQRYMPKATVAAELYFMRAARHAERVLVTTRFTEGDALQYAGIAPKKVARVPMLVPRFETEPALRPSAQRPYFIWPTNAAAHMNHANSFKALRIYWEEIGGKLDCHVTGVNTEGLLDAEGPFSRLLGNSAADIRRLRGRIRLKGELSDAMYQCELGEARFLWHPTQIDNGSFSVVDAAHQRIPALSSDYPAMHEIDDQFRLGLAWSPSNDPRRMASALKWMEDNAEERRSLLPSSEDLEQHSVCAFADKYWSVVRECL
jgi:glycosyltransferase involved in cell wall biosynthesis